MLYGDEVLWRAYGQLSRSIESGGSAFTHLYGEPFYGYLAKHPAPATLFHNAMTGFSEQEETAIMAAYDFSGVRTVIDVGGGQGGLALALLRAHPDLKAVIFDGTPPRDDTRASFARAGMTDRAEFLQGDFFAGVPRGGDLYILKSIIHNWDDSAAQTILSKCREAMPQSGRLLVAERVIPPGNAPSEAKLFDINMLVTLGGQERTEEEYKKLFDAAGLRLVQVIPTGSHLSLIVATRADSR
jgi:pimeloyl-ACP methyl ester carboxylesterase